MIYVFEDWMMCLLLGFGLDVCVLVLELFVQWVCDVVMVVLDVYQVVVLL